MVLQKQGQSFSMSVPASGIIARLALGISVTVGAFAFLGMGASKELHDLTLRAEEAVLDLVDLQLALDRLESNAVTVAVSSEQSVFDSDTALVLRIRRDYTAIRALTEEGSWLSTRLPSLDAMMSQEIETIAMVAQVRRSEASEVTGNSQRSGEGHLVIDKRRTLIRQMRFEGLQLLAIQNDVATRQLQQNQTVLAIGTLLVGALGVIGWSANRRDAGSRLRRDTEVSLHGPPDPGLGPH